MTAHALSPENTIKSFKKGAAFNIPKEKIIDIATYLSDFFEAKEKGKHFWWRWFDRFGEYYNRQFGPNWRRPDQDYWYRLEQIKFEALKHYYFPTR